MLQNPFEKSTYKNVKTNKIVYVIGYKESKNFGPMIKVEYTPSGLTGWFRQETFNQKFTKIT